VTVYDGKFERSLAAGKSPLASFGPIDRFGLTLGRGIPKRIKRAPGRGALFDFLRIEAATHRTHSPDRRLRFTSATLLVELPILGRDVGLSPIHRSAARSSRRCPFDQPEDSCPNRFGKLRPSVHDCGQVAVFGVQKRQAERQDTFAVFRNCLSNRYLVVPEEVAVSCRGIAGSAFGVYRGRTRASREAQRQAAAAACGGWTRRRPIPR